MDPNLLEDIDKTKVGIRGKIRRPNKYNLKKNLYWSNSRKLHKYGKNNVTYRKVRHIKSQIDMIRKITLQHIIVKIQEVLHKKTKAVSKRNKTLIKEKSLELC